MVDNASMTQQMPVPNLPLLRKVLDHIDAHPEEWDQWQFARVVSCGTAFCVAGHAAVMSGAEPVFSPGSDRTCTFRTAEGWTVDVESYARDLLGLTPDEASVVDGGLFDTANDRADVQRIAEAIAARAGEVL